MLVFDRLNSPRFLRRLALPVEASRGSKNFPQLILTKGGEKTAMVLRIEWRNGGRQGVDMRLFVFITTRNKTKYSAIQQKTAT